jgi:Concanavalin A-like lectin/glucanases superfamily
MTDRIAPLAIFLLALFLPAPAFAACSGPAGNAGDAIYNSASYVYQYCDGGGWHAMGPTGASGSCTGPVGSNGDIIYNSASHLYQFCAGQWIAMGPTGAGGSCGGTTSNLAGWWKLTDGSGTSAADSSGNGNTGALENTPTWITSGPTGGGLTLNGSNQFVSVSDAASIRLSGSWTASAWVNVTTLPTSGNRAKLIVRDDSTQNTNYGLDIDNGKHCTGVSWSVYFNNSSGTNYSTCYAATINTGTWYLVTGTWDGTTLSLYLNGAFVANSTPGATPASDSGGDLDLGHEYESTSDYLNGSLDDERIYNVLLSAAQVAGLYSFTPGNEGDIIYNSSNNIMQYCNGTWVGMGY